MAKKHTVATKPLKLVPRWAQGVLDPSTRRTYFFRNFDTSSVIIGRGSGCHIRMLDDRVSDAHALIKIRRNGHAEIIDISRNGTYIDGTRVTHPVMLMEGMQIHFGSQALLVATNGEGTFPIIAYTVQEFCFYAARLYGSIREASRHIGKSRKFIAAHISAYWKQRKRPTSWPWQWLSRSERVHESTTMAATAQEQR